MQHAKGLGEEKEADVAVGQGEAGGVGAGGRSGWKVTKLSRGGRGEEGGGGALEKKEWRIRAGEREGGRGGQEEEEN